MNLLPTWTLHGDGKSVPAGEVVAPDERLTWPRTAGIGLQHIVAMFGATFLVPLLTGFPPSTTLFFSGIGTLIFLLLTAGRVPSYLGSSFAFIAPIAAAKADHGMAGALGGIVLAGVALAVIGLIVQVAGAGWIRALLPPLVTGAIVALIGLNLAGAAKDNYVKAPVTATVTVALICLVTVLGRGILGRLAILGGVAAGYVTACVRGEVDFDAVGKADWVGLPTFHSPHFDAGVIALFVPVVLVLVAENIGHVKSVAQMTARDLDGVQGRALFADGISTALAGVGGGSGTTTYAENIGVMAATKVYSTAAYWFAAFGALVLSFCPKFGEAIATIPVGVLGGAGVVLYGMIGLLGARIWIEARIDFSNAINLTPAAIGLIIGIADFTWTIGDVQLAGIALGTMAVLLAYHVMRAINRFSRVLPDPTTPAPMVQLDGADGSTTMPSVDLVK
ncbi:MAG TPA: solute carrier family 23 protein [Flexivirga sp.]|uniref:uracil-xanthine permease family protein n=1 Tax=Flexivirga sp. TaxID=1962927 RepID=UPI002C50381E|nr:solute carrier family 23 protein [Flexivirga sp.]HWC23731.1 solute carrier family 23 protein [Flexivirga sp.]